MPITQVKISRSPIEGKLYRVEVYAGDKREKTIHFGEDKSNSFPDHKDKDRRMRYLERHNKERKDGYWNHHYINLKRPSYWSRWLLWEEPTITGSLNKIREKFPRIEFKMV